MLFFLVLLTFSPLSLSVQWIGAQAPPSSLPNQGRQESAGVTRPPAHHLGIRNSGKLGMNPLGPLGHRATGTKTWSSSESDSSPSEASSFESTGSGRMSILSPPPQLSGADTDTALSLGRSSIGTLSEGSGSDERQSKRSESKKGKGRAGDGSSLSTPESDGGLHLQVEGVLPPIPETEVAVARMTPVAPSCWQQFSDFVFSICAEEGQERATPPPTNCAPGLSELVLRTPPRTLAGFLRTGGGLPDLQISSPPSDSVLSQDYSATASLPPRSPSQDIERGDAPTTAPSRFHRPSLTQGLKAALSRMKCSRRKVIRGYQIGVGSSVIGLGAWAMTKS